MLTYKFSKKLGKMGTVRTFSGFFDFIFFFLDVTELHPSKKVQQNDNFLPGHADFYEKTALHSTKL
jgi:hypothetical protein